MSLGREITPQGQGGHATVAVDPLCDFDSSESYGPFAPIIATQAPWANLPSGHLLPDFGGGVGVGSGLAASDVQC